MKNSTTIMMGLASAAIGVAIGCGSSDHSGFVRASNDTNIKKAASLYQLYASRYGYVGPKSKEELLSFLTTNEKIAKNLDLMGVDRDNLDSYFVSENDGEEFLFRWGVFVNPDLERAKEPVVFESVGKDGVRLVMLSNRRILEVTSDKNYKSLLRGKVSRDEAMTDLDREQAALGADG